MMNFNEFKGYVWMAAQNKIPGAELDITEVKKANGGYTGLIDKSGNGKANPTANLDLMYNRYKTGTDIDRVVDDIVAILAAPVPDGIDADIFMDYDKVKDKLFLRLMNADANSDYLKDVVFTTKADLALVPTIKVSETGSAVVKKSMLDTWGVGAFTVLKDAMENSPKILPVSINAMPNLLGFGTDETNDMIVVMNSTGVHGASALFYDGVFIKVASKINGAFYALPSSIHEWICIPTSMGGGYKKLEAMVQEINRNVVAKEDWLSDRVYKYVPGVGFDLASNLEQ